MLSDLRNEFESFSTEGGGTPRWSQQNCAAIRVFGLGESPVLLELTKDEAAIEMAGECRPTPK